MRGGGPCSTAELLAWWCATQFSVERVTLRFSHATGVGIGQDCPCFADQVSSVERLSAKPSANEQFEAPGVAGGKQVSLDQPVDEPSRSDIDEQGSEQLVAQPRAKGGWTGRPGWAADESYEAGMGLAFWNMGSRKREFG